MVMVGGAPARCTQRRLYLQSRRAKTDCRDDRTSFDSQAERTSVTAMRQNLMGEALAPSIGQFTGSDTVGRLLAIEAAKHLKPCVLELGGKAPAVVRPNTL